MTALSLSLGPLVLVGRQAGPLLDVSITANGLAVGEMQISLPTWTGLVAVVDVLAAADRRHAGDRAEIERLRRDRDSYAKEITTNDLSAAVDALGEIMTVLAGRRLLARGIKNDVIRAKIEADLKTDEQLEEIAARGFEAGAMALALAKHPGATMHVCNPTEKP